MSIIPMPSTSALCRITCRPSWPALSTRRSCLPKPGASCAAWSSTTPQACYRLNMVEIEIGVLRGQCLDRRIDDPEAARP